MATKPKQKISLLFIAASLAATSTAWVPSTVSSTSISHRCGHGSHRKPPSIASFSTKVRSKKDNNHDDDHDDRQRLYKDETSTSAATATSTSSQLTEYGISYIGGDPCGSKYNDDPFDATSKNNSFKPGFPDGMKDRIAALARERLKKEEAEKGE
mmetsp:Transcript_17590/g.36648  ORF Transcript_17590/g.36648 Transcript_17590/m.36648 type:complete len:155 (+) Transcript_17590:38-502(+)|eukprot:CAMPEP_0171347772 /NCGR_PEP_ID=MMETSP0878-20121228/28961_1 /TAXON_ID=67004 /ORGANISM="Thalassiosira weissflogii, Strain CCMP1336" /LENGTH=154 /DNA_ID=CAMNT_0011851911 /DNA_START=19 /DNA_END=483 /DNA_ORIENTATION=+